MKNIFVAGHNGMVGSALVRLLSENPEVNVITIEKSDLDLTNQNGVEQFFNNNAIDEVYIAAAKVGGIHANNVYPADFIYQNLMIQSNIINTAHKNNVNKLMFLGSSCIYPKLAEQPMSERCLLTGFLEPTNEPYAIAKIAGIKMCESYNRQHGRDYRAVMPTNLYGEGDNYHPENSHVIPGLIRRIHEAKEQNLSEVVCWGSGTPKREFLYVDDMARAAIFVMNLDQAEYKQHVSNDMCIHVNVGYGTDCTIKELVETIVEVIGYTGKLMWDTSKPDGPPRKFLNCDLIRSMGWKPTIDLRTGLQMAYNCFIAEYE